MAKSLLPYLTDLNPYLFYPIDQYRCRVMTSFADRLLYQRPAVDVVAGREGVRPRFCPSASDAGANGKGNRRNLSRAVAEPHSILLVFFCCLGHY